MGRILYSQLYVLKPDAPDKPRFSFCKREPNMEKRKKNRGFYKKGYEIRISLKDKAEVENVKASLMMTSF